ncbi:DUF885 domain-containing protein [Caulobacter mirabilis]|uniref:DUF885 domain-containing protein n=1 Tax=Caulobacter mirabilis TaxID=69666 RepID=UPI0015597D8B|nr:DUF885 family protein [Caulobacter mirabilis]
MQNRRELLFSAAAATAVAVAVSPKDVFAAPAKASDPAEVKKMNALFDSFVDKQMRRQPEAPTSLGLDKDALAWTKSALSDQSLTAIKENAQIGEAQLKQLRTVDRSKLAGLDATNYDTVDFVMNVSAEFNRKYDYIGAYGGAPYVISQLTGSYQSMPDFLDSQHTIETKADADAYMARVEAFGRMLDQEVEVARHDAALGVIPADFTIDKALTQFKAMLGVEADAAPLVTSVARRAKEKNIAGDYGGQAAKLYVEKVRPALERQQALLQEWRGKAVHDAGVWRLPKGEEYYRTSLESYTTSKITPAEIHKIGLDMVASLGAEADKLMRKAGYASGTVGERFRQMYADPKQHYPNTDEGKVELIKDLNKKVAEIMPKLPKYFGQLPKAPLEIRRVPKAIEAGAPGGYYNSPTLDGSRPGIYWINLRDSAEQPRFTLPTLTFHEAIPGHHLQLALNNEAGDLPLIRKMIGFSGYSEGWALYAEELAVEMGMYENDVEGHIGMIHDAMFRAVRLVVDSGMHDKRWSREQAVKYYVDTIGDQEASAITEIERYVVWPGQACSYMVGKIEWLRLRAKARKVLGKKFDIRKFHDVGLLSGGVPLTVLETVIDGYIAGAK